MVPIKELEAIGLTKGEIKVYVSLLELGESSTGPIANESGVSRSKIYNILDKLTKKGLVGQFHKENIAYFRAMKPRRILDYFDEQSAEFQSKRKQIELLLPQLENKIGKENAPATALYEGFKSIKNFYNSLLDDLSPGQTYLVIGASYPRSRPEVRSFFQNFHMRRAEKGIHVKMLANIHIRDTIVPATKKLSQVRFLPEYLLANMTILVHKEKSFLFFWSKVPMGFLLESEEIANGFRTYFDTFWKIAKR
jgi:sugar-specific transcriptional regulator TrmB